MKIANKPTATLLVFRNTKYTHIGVKPECHQTIAFSERRRETNLPEAYLFLEVLNKMLKVA